MKKKLYIVGAGGFGREVLAWALEIQRVHDEWEISGFLDANPCALQSFDYDYPIVGDPETFLIMPDTLFVIALGDPIIKLRICRQMVNRGARFTTLIHPTAVIGLNNQIGMGCIICPGGIVTSNVTLGDFVTLNVHATVGHDAVIGDGCTLSGHVDVTGGASLGEGVFVGSHATVLPKVKIGARVRVGAGSVVLRNVKPDVTVFGSPAKPIPQFK